MRLHDIVEYRANERSEAVALRDGLRTMTYGELNTLANSFADALAAAGLGAGDRVAILAHNCLEYLAFYFGAAKADIVTVPLNQRLAPQEWAYIVNDSGSRCVVARGDLVAPMDSLRGDLPSVDRFVAMDTSQPGWADWTSWLEEAPDRPVASGMVQRHNATVQMYTSGTTGRPKGAILTQDSLMASITQLLASSINLASGCVHVVMPFSHVGSTMVAMVNLFAGGSVYVQETFDPHEVVRVLDEERITSTTLVPAMIQSLLNSVPDVAERDYRDLDVIGYGGSPISAEVLRHAMDVFGCDFFQGFGQTEASGSVTFLTPGDHRRAMAGEEHLLRSAGRPTIGTEVRVVDANSRDCAPGVIGEIIARGPQLMSGYWNRPEETATTLRDGWLYLGDAGTFDDDGYLYVMDRIKDMIVSGGENVYPAEIERVLFEHRAVADAAVIGVPDERWGEAVKACVVLRKDAHVGESEIISFCRERIAGFKVPKSVDFVAELPRNASMKVLKTELRAPYWLGRSRSVG